MRRKYTSVMSAVAAAASAPAHEADDLRAMLRHARISRDQAAEFWERVFELIDEFSTCHPRATRRSAARSWGSCAWGVSGPSYSSLATYGGGFGPKACFTVTLSR